jgi:Zn-dependent peptidase ImmA (M78 family)
MGRRWHDYGQGLAEPIEHIMSTTWSRLAGDTSRFAVALSLHPDPDDGAGATPEEATSWGALQLWVEGKNLTLHTIDGQSGDAVQWYLLPFLEWLAGSWNPLLHEERPPGEPQADDAVHDLRATRYAPPTFDDRDALRWEQGWYDWWRRHALPAAREGGLFPNVVFRHWRDAVEVSWDSETMAGADGLQFAVPYGRARLRPTDVAEPLYAVAIDAAQELRERLPASKRIGQLVRSLEKVSDAALSPERLLWMVDAGRGGRAARQWRHVVKAFETASEQARSAALSIHSDALVVTGSCHAALLFGAISPSLGNDDVAKLAHVLIDAYDANGEQGPLQKFARPQPLKSMPGPIWEEGWSLAEETLGALGPNSSWVDVESILRQHAVPILDVELTDQEIRGVSIAGEQHRWTVCVNPAYHDGNGDEIRRFTMAHELCHLLYDRGKEQKVAIASGPWAPKDIERRANAFAAMFLMPRDLVRIACRDAGPLDKLEAVESVARQLHTSVTATLHQLANLYVIDEGTRDRLLARLRQR